MDTPLPDFCPDVARLIRVDCTPFTESCEIQNDKAVAKGKVVYDLLYETDYKSRLKYCSFVQEFSQSVPIPRSGATDLTAFCSSKCERIACQLLSPRRLVIKATLAADFDLEGDLALTAVAVQEDGEAFFRKKVIGFEGKTDFSRETFPFGERFPLNQNEKSIGEILFGSVTLEEPQISLSPGRAEIRSTALMQILCEEENNEGQYYTSVRSLPLSFDLQKEEIADFKRVSVVLEPMDPIFTPELDQYGENRVIKADFSVRATLKISEPKAYTLAEDLFEKGFDSLPVTGNAILPTIFSQQEKSFVTEAKLPEMTPAPESILISSVKEKSLRAEPAEGGVRIHGEFILNLLTRTPEGIYSFDHPVSYEGFFDCELPPNQFDVLAEIRPAEVIATRHSDGSVTAKIISTASLTLTTQREESFISELSSRTPREAEADEGALIYRFPQKGEDLWCIAKSYRVSPEGIILANPDKFDESGNLLDSGAPILIKT